MEAVLHELPTEPAVKQITIDFERALWSVMRALWSVMGCVFHWTQALWRKVSLMSQVDFTGIDHLGAKRPIVFEMVGQSGKLRFSFCSRYRH